jgi:hypothetical protein
MHDYCPFKRSIIATILHLTSCRKHKCSTVQYVAVPVSLRFATSPCAFCLTKSYMILVEDRGLPSVHGAPEEKRGRGEVLGVLCDSGSGI